MEEINKNLIALWKGLSPQRKISLIGSFLLSLTVLGSVVYFASKPKLTLLYGGLAPAEASKVVEYLDSKKITYDVSDGGRAVMVPAAQVYSIRMGLASEGIPTLSDGGVGFELFDKPTFGMSDFMQRANYYRALEGELARTIRQLDEVSNARVLIVVPEDKLFGQDQQIQQAKASVFIQLQPGKSLDDSQVRAIRFLVANGVEGLQPEHVAVIDSSGRAMAETDSGSSTSEGQMSDKERQARADLENYLQDKAQSMLDQVLGPGQAVVRVASEIDYSSVQETSETYDPKNSAIKTETSTTETSTTTTPSNSTGGAGVSANSTSGSNSNQNLNDQKKENTSNEYEVSKVTQSKIIGAGAIKRLTIALMLNERKPAVAGGKPVPRSAAEIQSLENIVKAAVGFTQNDTRQDMIQSQEVAFADLFADSAAPAPKSTMTEQINDYMPYVTQGCLALLAFGILLYFRSVFLSSGGKGSSEPDSFEALLHNYTVTSNGGVANGNGNGHAPVRNGINPQMPAILTPQELSRLIRENPDNASHALRQWLKRN
jgi:flagellar M-ring protein FliF